MRDAQAMLDMCKECGLHGCFQLGNGRRSREFASKEDALKELQDLFDHQLVTRDELQRLSDTVIHVDKMPTASREAGYLSRLTCIIINAINEDES